MDQVALFKPGSLTPTSGNMEQQSPQAAAPAAQDADAGFTAVNSVSDDPWAPMSSASSTPGSWNHVSHVPAIEQQLPAPGLLPESFDIATPVPTSPLPVAAPVPVGPHAIGVMPGGLQAAPLLTPNVAGEHQLAKCSPSPVETLDKAVWQEFVKVLEEVGLDPDAEHKVHSGQTAVGWKPDRVAAHMMSLYDNCKWREWDWSVVGSGQNPQMSIVCAEMMKIFTSLGQVHQKILWCVLCNGKLLTTWYQHTRSGVARKLFMGSEHGGANFKYKDHNEGFKRWIKEKAPECLHPFPGQTDGIWLPVFKTDLLVTIIVKMPIADEYLQAPHPVILASFKDTAEKHPALKAALTACCDLNVHDNHDKIRNTETTKWVYCKTSTLSEDAMMAFEDWIPQCATVNGQELLPWSMSVQKHNGVEGTRYKRGAELQPCFIGGVPASQLQKFEGSQMQPQMKAYMSLEDAQRVASKSNAGSSALVPVQKKMANQLAQKHDMKQWALYMSEYLYKAEIRELLTSPIVTEFLHMYFSGNLHGLHAKVTEWLYCNKFPDLPSGITIKFAHSSFPPQGKEFNDDGYAKCGPGQYVLCMSKPVGLRQDWTRWGDAIIQDGPGIVAWDDADGYGQWPSTCLCSMTLVFQVGKDGVWFPKDGVGILPHQFLSELSDIQMQSIHNLWMDTLAKSMGTTLGQQALGQHWQAAFQHQQAPAAQPVAASPAAAPAVLGPRCNPGLVVPGPEKPQTLALGIKHLQQQQQNWHPNIAEVPDTAAAAAAAPVACANLENLHLAHGVAEQMQGFAASPGTGVAAGPCSAIVPMKVSIGTMPQAHAMASVEQQMAQLQQQLLQLQAQQRALTAAPMPPPVPPVPPQVQPPMQAPAAMPVQPPMQVPPQVQPPMQAPAPEGF